MKDEEMAEEYCNEMMCTICSNIRCRYKGKCAEWETRKTTFLAGLKAGRPQWHTDPNDLPKMIEDERKISQDVWLHIKDWGREVGYYDYRKNYWVVRCRQVNLSVIAWCELPTLDKEIEK